MCTKYASKMQWPQNYVSFAIFCIHMKKKRCKNMQDLKACNSYAQYAKLCTPATPTLLMVPWLLEQAIERLRQTGSE